MYPSDLKGTLLRLPEGDKYSAVLFTGMKLRHLRFGYLIQDRFPGLVKRWWAYKPGRNEQQVTPKLTLYQRVKECVKDNGFLALPIIAIRKLARNFLEKTRLGYGQVEKEMFGQEIEAIRKKGVVEVQPIFTSDPNAEMVYQELCSIKPYFLLTLGGPLLEKRIIESTRGLAINQHAGWSPEFKGSNTTEMALYHRQVNKVGSTVHIMSTAADAGPILRRSSVTIHPGDSPAHCFNSVVALGTALLIEVVEGALENDDIYVFDQPLSGRTYRAADYDEFRKKCVIRDFDSGWLKSAILSRKNW